MIMNSHDLEEYEDGPSLMASGTRFRTGYRGFAARGDGKKQNIPTKIAE
jgi:hypothetical protein